MANHDRRHEHKKRPSLGSFFTNWTEYEAPLTTKASMTARNLWKRVILRQSCCGNHDQPGC